MCTIVSKSLPLSSLLQSQSKCWEALSSSSDSALAAGNSFESSQPWMIFSTVASTRKQCVQSVFLNSMMHRFRFRTAQQSRMVNSIYWSVAPNNTELLDWTFYVQFIAHNCWCLPLWQRRIRNHTVFGNGEARRVWSHVLLQCSLYNQYSAWHSA